MKKLMVSLALVVSFVISVSAQANPLQEALDASSSQSFNITVDYTKLWNEYVNNAVQLLVQRTDLSFEEAKDRVISDKLAKEVFSKRMSQYKERAIKQLKDVFAGKKVRACGINYYDVMLTINCN